MEKTTFLFLGIIIAYLAYSFIKSRMVSEKGNEYTNKKEEVSTGQASAPLVQKEKEMAAVAAVIAVIMGEMPYVLKRVYAKANVDEKISNWRTAGRTDLMKRKNLLK